MMTKREQVRMVRPYRSRFKTLEWDRYSTEFRKIHSSLASDEQMCLFEELAELYPNEDYFELLCRLMKNT
jgi:hypothetical protein